MIAKEEIIAPSKKNNSNFVAGHTHTQHPLAAAAGLAVIRYILDHDSVSNAKAMGD